jgi:hypothetical protein
MITHDVVVFFSLGSIAFGFGSHFSAPYALTYLSPKLLPIGSCESITSSSGSSLSNSCRLEYFSLEMHSIGSYGLAGAYASSSSFFDSCVLADRPP